MKPLLFWLLSICFILFPLQHLTFLDKVDAGNLTRLKKIRAAGCSPDWKTFSIDTSVVHSVPLLPGTGVHAWKINTVSDSAQIYFNQAINLYYGFHIIEAIASFKKAQVFDPECAMLYWGEALAYGPNINDLGYSASPEALKAVQKADSLSGNEGPVEKMLIKAMDSRYNADTTMTREELNNRYANSMRLVHEKFPGPETTTLYADALMLLHPWDLWKIDGSPKPWTPEIIGLLEEVLKKYPVHPGANHYYIHAVEASPDPGRALLSAERLASISPGLSHLVHMPSHIYIRTGDYKKGIRVNHNAIASYKSYASAFPPVTENAPLYDFHNRHMEASCAMQTDDYMLAFQSARNCSNAFDISFLALDAPLGGYIQYVYMTPLFTMIQFEKWEDILAEKEPDSSFHYAVLLKNFGDGMAFANTGRLDEAIKSLSLMDDRMNAPDLAIRFGPFNTPKAAALVARNILHGEILNRQGKLEESVAAFTRAIETEDSMVYNEPRDWMLPAREFLGNVYLQHRQYSKAEKIFTRDLQLHPKNKKSVRGLRSALNRNRSEE